MSQTLSLKQQADFLSALSARTLMSDGKPADITHTSLSPADVSVLRALAFRLERMAPFEAQIRQLVTR